MTISLNVNSKPFSYCPSFLSRPTDHFCLFDSSFDNDLFNSMISEWNERTSLTSLIHQWSSVIPPTAIPKTLTLLLYNTQGIRSRYAEIRTLLDDLQPTIMTLVETGKVDEKELRKFTNDYVHFISPGSNAWGGVIVLVHRSVQCSFVFSSDNFLVVDVLLSSSTLRVL